MPLTERVYAVLLVSAVPGVNAALLELLPQTRFSPVRTVADLGAAKRAFGERAYDIVLVNSPLPDGPGARFAVDVSERGGAVALLLLNADSFGETALRVQPHGVFTLQKPVSRAGVQTALEWLVSARERLRQNETKTLTLEEKMEEIRLVNRAKWLLIEREKLDEPAAHRYIEKRAMDSGRTRRAVAQEIINGFSE